MRPPPRRVATMTPERFAEILESALLAGTVIVGDEDHGDQCVDVERADLSGRRVQVVLSDRSQLVIYVTRSS